MNHAQNLLQQSLARLGPRLVAGLAAGLLCAIVTPVSAYEEIVLQAAEPFRLMVDAAGKMQKITVMSTDIEDATGHPDVDAYVHWFVRRDDGGWQHCGSAGDACRFVSSAGTSHTFHIRGDYLKRAGFLELRVFEGLADGTASDPSQTAPGQARTDWSNVLRIPVVTPSTPPLIQSISKQEFPVRGSAKPGDYTFVIDAWGVEGEGEVQVVFRGDTMVNPERIDAGHLIRVTVPADYQLDHVGEIPFTVRTDRGGDSKAKYIRFREPPKIVTTGNHLNASGDASHAEVAPQTPVVAPLPCKDCPPDRAKGVGGFAPGGFAPGGVKAIGPKPDDPRAKSDMNAGRTPGGLAPGGMNAIGPKPDDPRVKSDINAGRTPGGLAPGGMNAIGPKPDDPRVKSDVNSGRTPGGLAPGPINAIGPKPDDPRVSSTVHAIGPKQDDPRAPSAIQAIGPKQDDPRAPSAIQAIGPKQDDPAPRPLGATSTLPPGGVPAAGVRAIGPKPDDPGRGAVVAPGGMGAGTNVTKSFANAAGQHFQGEVKENRLWLTVDGVSQVAPDGTYMNDGRSITVQNGLIVQGGLVPSSNLRLQPLRR